MKVDKLERSTYIVNGILWAVGIGIAISVVLGILSVLPVVPDDPRMWYVGIICGAGIGTLPLALLGMMNVILSGMLVLSFEYRHQAVFVIINIVTGIAFGAFCGLLFPLVARDPNRPMGDIEIFPLWQTVSVSVFVCLTNTLIMTRWIIRDIDQLDKGKTNAVE